MAQALISLFVIFASASTLAAAELAGSSVDPSQLLPGNAYYMSTGPSVAADVPYQFDGTDYSGVMQGAKCLRVTLFSCEGLHSMWVEQLLFNRAGGGHTASCYGLEFSELGSSCGKFIGRIPTPEIEWTDDVTFEFTAEARRSSDHFSYEPTRFAVQWVGDGKFEVTCDIVGD